MISNFFKNNKNKINKYSIEIEIVSSSSTKAPNEILNNILETK